MRRGISELNGEGEAVGGVIVMRYGENASEVPTTLPPTVVLMLLT